MKMVGNLIYETQSYSQENIMLTEADGMTIKPLLFKWGYNNAEGIALHLTK